MVGTDRRPYDLTKRAIDIVVSSVGLVITFPIQILTAGVVAATHGPPVLFRQKRPGRNARIFEMVKFRTMLEPTSDRITDADRLTRVGKFLRSTSLDELPTLWNVFKGDMSLVGPRPLLVDYLDLYSGEQARRHLVRPGITGLAQTSGRNGISWEEKFVLDIKYVENRSLAMDARILLATFGALVKRDGISQKGHVTMEPFMGSNLEGKRGAK